MEIRTLETFQVVSQELNLTRAANKLNYSQPTVTKHIQSLENEIGTDLLIKKDGSYTLTFAGEQLLKYTTNILRELNLIKTIRPDHGEKFTMQLQGHDYYLFKYFIPTMNTMLEKFPTLSFQLDGNSNEKVIQKLVRNEIDLGIVSGNITSSELLYEKIGAESTALCISSKLYKKERDIEYYLEKYPVVIDKLEKYSYDSFFHRATSHPTIINCSSDEAVEKAIRRENMLGIIRIGRLEEFIETGEINVIKHLTRTEDINIVMHISRLENKYVSSMFNAICYRFKTQDTPKNQIFGRSH